MSTKNFTVAVKADRQTYARLITIQQHRNVDLKEVLKYELSALPLSIANPDGSLCKTVKSKLHSVLEPSIPQILSPPSNTIAIFDAMVLLCKLPPFLETFGDISDHILSKITKGSGRIVFFVTDHYREYSIKSMERERRTNIGIIRVAISRRDQKKPKQFAKFLGSSENKISLINFLFDDGLHTLNMQDV